VRRSITRPVPAIVKPADVAKEGRNVTVRLPKSILLFAPLLLVFLQLRPEVEAQSQRTSPATIPSRMVRLVFFPVSLLTSRLRVTTGMT